MTERPKDYAVGYARPPKHTMWKKGQCGNPKRRYNSRIPKGTAQMVEELFARRVNIVEGGTPRNVSVFEAILTQLLLKEMAGNKRAFALRLGYQKFVTSRRGKREVIIRDETGLDSYDESPIR